MRQRAVQKWPSATVAPSTQEGSPASSTPCGAGQASDRQEKLGGVRAPRPQLSDGGDGTYPLLQCAVQDDPWLMLVPSTQGSAAAPFTP